MLYISGLYLNSLARNSLAPKTPLAIPLPIFRPEPAGASETLARLIEPPQTKAVKIYGAAGNRNLPAHQSGFLFSSQGQVLTAWSYVLDTDQISVWTSRSRWRSASGYSLSATSPRSTTTSAARSGPERVTKRFANRPNPGPPPGRTLGHHPAEPWTTTRLGLRLAPDVPNTAPLHRPHPPRRPRRPRRSPARRPDPLPQPPRDPLLPSPPRRTHPNRPHRPPPPHHPTRQPTTRPKTPQRLNDPAQRGPFSMRPTRPCSPSIRRGRR